MTSTTPNTPARTTDRQRVSRSLRVGLVEGVLNPDDECVDEDADRQAVEDTHPRPDINTTPSPTDNGLES
jgi:hypothetical protein